MVLFAVVLGFCQTTATKQTTGSRFPVVIGKVALWNQTAPTAGTLFTPKHFGVYRVSGTALKTSGNDGDYVSVCIDWADGNGGQRQCVTETGVGEIQVGPIVFRDLKGTPITFSTSTYSTLNYNLFIVVEQIM